MTLEISINPITTVLDEIILKEVADPAIVSALLKSEFLLNDDKHTDELQLQKYMNKIDKTNKLAAIKYKRKYKVGRTCALNSIGHQSFRRCIRHTLAHKYYIDIDIVNCHPEILYQICYTNGIKCDLLGRYVHEREKYLKQVQNTYDCDRSLAKLLFIRLLYGGTVENWALNNQLVTDAKISDKFINELQKELKIIAKLFYDSNCSIRKVLPRDKQYDHFSILSYILQEWEHRVLCKVYEYLQKNQLIKNNIVSLCFDGLMFKRPENIPIDTLCKQISAYIKNEMNLELQFSEKIMDEMLDIEVADSDKSTDPTKPVPINQLYEYVLSYSFKRNLIKTSTYVYTPTKKSPIVYEIYKTHKDYINEIFNEDSAYYTAFRHNPYNLSKICKYLEDFDESKLPFMKLNKYIFSFNNGYLDISDLFNLKFIPYEDDKRYEPHIITSVHYDIDFNIEWLTTSVSQLSTPILDQLCSYHIRDSDILIILYGMFGRLHYEIGKHDHWNCMLFLKSGANTGKSTIGNILMHNHQNIGTISGKMEKNFGLQSIYDKDIIYNPDMSQNFTTLLDKSDFQKMIEGSHIDIPIKNQASINNYKWTASLFFLANYLPEYKDSSGAIPRRLCIFYLDNYVTKRDTSLQQRCIDTESHLILLKTLKCYAYMCESFKGTFEDWGVNNKRCEYFKRGYDEMTQETNALYKYLSMAPNEADSWVSYDPNEKTLYQEFKRAVELFFYKHSDKQKLKRDDTTLGRFGFIIKQINVCANCGMIPQNRCCDLYNRQNRRKKLYILNMKLNYKVTEYINNTYE